MATSYEFGTRSPFGCTVGDRIRLIQMSDDPFPMEPGSEGTVIGFCDTRGLEQIVVEWDSGRGLSLIPRKDRFVVVDAYYTTLKFTDLSGVDLSGARYDADTVWPDGFDPEAAEAIRVDR